MDPVRDQDALRVALHQFTGSFEVYRHVTGALFYTEGVKYLAEHGRLHWLIDVIASLQPRALRDYWLQEFQLWELRITGAGASVICLRDSEDEAFRQDLKFADSALDYVRLYVENGTLLLPSEH
jgi:hypothetical protein